MIDATLSADYSALATAPAYRQSDTQREWRPTYPLGYTPRPAEPLPRYDLKPQEPAGPRAQSPAAAPLHARDLQLNVSRAHASVRARAVARRDLNAGYLRAKKAAMTQAEYIEGMACRMSELAINLLRRAAVPMTLAEIAAALGYSANTMRYGLQRLMSEGRPRIARRQLRAGKTNIYQFLAAGLEWPEPPPGAREVRRSEPCEGKG